MTSTRVRVLSRCGVPEHHTHKSVCHNGVIYRCHQRRRAGDSGAETAAGAGAAVGSDALPASIARSARSARSRDAARSSAKASATATRVRRASTSARRRSISPETAPDEVSPGVSSGAGVTASSHPRRTNAGIGIDQPRGVISAPASSSSALWRRKVLFERPVIETASARVTRGSISPF